MSHTIDVIVNVDDLGLHPAVRRAVEHCAAVGTVTSASVLANGPDLEEVTEIPGVSLGAHLNILRGAPVSPPREIRSLVDARGLFPGKWSTLALRVALGAVDRDEVRLEWSRQVDRLQQMGLRLSHLDGEKHTQCFPSLFDIACEVAEAHGIRFVRISAERYGNLAFGAASLRRGLLKQFATRLRPRPTVRTTDSVWGIAEQGAALTPDACARALGSMPSGSVEIVCHPGDSHPSDPELPSTFGRMRVQELWRDEFNRLSSRAWMAAAAANGWRLTNFNDLERTRA